MFRKIRNTKLGFTLIELLVVISIIGVLSSVVLASVKTARSKAKNTKFVNELKSLQNAMALYVSQYRQLPSTYSWAPDSQGNTSLDTNLAPLVTNKFIPRIPHFSGWPASSLYSNPNQTYMSFQANYEYSYGSYTYSYGYACGQFDSWNEFKKSGQMARLFIYTKDPDLENLKLEDTLSRCVNSPWAGVYCYAYSLRTIANDGYKYYCVSF